MDISAFKVVSVAPARLDQVGKAAGGPWGSTNVDKQLEGYLKVRWLMSSVGWPRPCERDAESGDGHAGGRGDRRPAEQQQSRAEVLVPLFRLVRSRQRFVN